MTLVPSSSSSSFFFFSFLFLGGSASAGSNTVIKSLKNLRKQIKIGKEWYSWKFMITKLQNTKMIMIKLIKIFILKGTWPASLNTFKKSKKQLSLQICNQLPAVLNHSQLTFNIRKFTKLKFSNFRLNIKIQFKCSFYNMDTADSKFRGLFYINLPPRQIIKK